MDSPSLSDIDNQPDVDGWSVPTQELRLKAEGPKVHHGYAWLNVIGRGGWGKVRKVIHLETQTPCAVKILHRHILTRKLKNGMRRLQEEFQLVQQLDHPNLIKYRELRFSEDYYKVFLFMEFCEDCIEFHRIDLKEGLDPKEHYERLNFLRLKFRQVFAGLAHLHANHVAHHDIKPANILIDPKGTVKLVDFGIAEKYDPEEGCKCFYGTPTFQPPEIASNVDSVPFDGAKADVWSAGVTLYYLVSGRYPFVEKNVYFLLVAIEKDPVVIPNLGDRLLEELLSKLLTKDPTRRLSAEEAYNHPWFTQPLTSMKDGEKTLREGCGAIFCCKRE